MHILTGGILAQQLNQRCFINYASVRPRDKLLGINDHVVG